MYGNYYNYYIDYLLDKKVLIRKSKYLVGEKCYTYSLNPRLLYKKEIIRYKNRDKVVVKKLYLVENQKYAKKFA